MGWTHTPGATKDDIVRELLTEYAPLDSELRGDVLWAVIDDEIVGRYIVCFLLGDAGQDGWGYKDIHESMGPHYYDCPLRLLDLAPVACRRWRTKVRARHASQST
jgi:hypothetical protein